MRIAYQNYLKSSIWSKRPEQKQICLELIFIDDGSGDKSLDILLEFKKTLETKIIKLSRNLALIKAVAGLKFVTGDAFSVLSADLQDPPNLI